MGFLSGLFGGGGEENTFRGYDYFIGCHFIACVGPIDKVKEIRVEDRVAWEGGSSITPPKNLYLGCSNSGTQVNIKYTTSQQVNVELAEVQWTGDDGSSGGFIVDDDIHVDEGDEKVIYVNFSATLGVTYTVMIRTITEFGNSLWIEGTITTTVADKPLTFQAAEPVAQDVAYSERITIAKPRLFGADDSGGGVIGDVDVRFGFPSQEANDYLVENGDVATGHRGLLGFVLRHVNIGMSPYLKPWAFFIQRCFRGQDGADQWYKSKAGIPRLSSFKNAAVYFALDASNSMNINGTLGPMKQAMQLTVDELEDVQGDDPIDIQMVSFNTEILSDILRRDIDSTGWDDIRTWISDIFAPVGGDTSFVAPLGKAQDFFDGAGSKQRIIVFVSDGDSNTHLVQDAADIIAATGAECYCFNIDTGDLEDLSLLDNTPEDEIPVIPSEDPSSMAISFLVSFVAWYDMNFVHILRECLTNTEWGAGNPEVDMGTTWMPAADKAYSEGLGLSTVWNKESTVQEFMQNIQAHGDASVYLDRRTGLWEIKSIRDDYVFDDLPVFSSSTNILSHNAGPNRRDSLSAVNDLTLTFSDYENSNKGGSRSLQDLALIQESGRVSHDSVDYEAITYAPLASRILARDLRGVSAPIITGEIAVNRDGDTLNPGDPFILDEPRYEIHNEVCRVLEIKYGGTLQEEIIIEYSSDVYALDEGLLIESDRAQLPVSTVLEAPEHRMVEEGTYYEAVKRIGSTSVDNALASSPEIGALFVTSEKPAGNPLRADIYVGSVDEGDMSFSPVGFTTAELTQDPTDNIIQVETLSSATILKISRHSLALIEDEIIRIDSRGENSIVVGRGCLDTVPGFHPVGTPIIFFSAYYSTTGDDYFDGTAINVKLLPVNSTGILDYDATPTDSLTFASRMIRPLPVSDFKGNGQYILYDSDDTVDMVLTWKHRDRKVQISDPVDDFTQGDPAEETGVSYIAESVWVDGDFNDISTHESVNVGTNLTHTVSSGFLAAPPTGAAFMEFRVHSQRSGYQEWQTPTLRMPISGYGEAYGERYGA